MEQQVKVRGDLVEPTLAGWTPSAGVQVPIVAPASRDLRPLIKKASSSLPAVRLAVSGATCKDHQTFPNYRHYPLFKHSVVGPISLQQLCISDLPSFLQQCNMAIDPIPQTMHQRILLQFLPSFLRSAFILLQFPLISIIFLKFSPQSFPLND